MHTNEQLYPEAESTGNQAGHSGEMSKESATEEGDPHLALGREMWKHW